MHKKRAFMRAGYAVLFALVALVFYCVYETTQRKPTERFHMFSAHGVSIVSWLCLGVGVVAGAAAVFFVAKGLYVAFARPAMHDDTAA